MPYHRQPRLDQQHVIGVRPGRQEQHALRLAAGRHFAHVAVALPISRPVDDDAEQRPLPSRGAAAVGVSLARSWTSMALGGTAGGPASASSARPQGMVGQATGVGGFSPWAGASDGQGTDGQ
jgi:hypothetical protein